MFALQALLFLIFFQLRVEGAVFPSQETVHRFRVFSFHRAIVFPLRPGPAGNVRRLIGLSAVVEADQMNHGVARVEPPRQQVLKLAVVSGKVALFDRMRADRSAPRTRPGTYGAAGMRTLDRNISTPRSRSPRTSTRDCRPASSTSRFVRDRAREGAIAYCTPADAS